MPNPENIRGQGFHTNPERINRKGRPKKLPNLDELLADVLGDEAKDGKTAAEVILMVIRAKALKGDLRAAEILYERAYGRTPQIIDAKIDNVNKTTITLADGSIIEF